MRTLLLTGMIALLGCLLFSQEVAAATPKEDIRKTVDQVLQVLRDSKIKGVQRREKLSTLIRARFDFDTMAQFTLGKYWKSASAEDQKKFIRLYSDLLEESYIGRVEAYSDETVDYEAETIENDRAEVKTRVHQGKNELPVTYRLTQRNGEWFVYDVLIEEVSMIKNYRSSYGEIIRKDGFAALLERMAEKLRELRNGTAKPATGG